MSLISRLTATFGLAALALGAGVAAPALAASPIVGHVYVNDNTSGTNTVSGFDRHADGSLTAMSGSPFAVGGAGAGSITPSQGAIQFAAGGKLLLAVDEGSNQISVLYVLPNGALHAVPGSPFPSGGNKPVSLAVHGRAVFVANSGDGGANYTGFYIVGTGQLFPIFGSTYSLPDGSGPGDILFNNDGTHLIGVRVNTSLIDSFEVPLSGRIVPAPGSPFASQIAGPFGSEFRPTNGGQLYVTDAHGGPGTGSVSAFAVTANGILSSIGSSPYGNQQSGTCWIDIAHNGQFLYALSTGSAMISSYAIAPDGSLNLLGNTALNSSAKKPFDLRLSPDDTFLYVIDPGANDVSIFSVNGGTLTEQQGSPVALPSGATPFGIAVS